MSNRDKITFGIMFFAGILVLFLISIVSLVNGITTNITLTQEEKVQIEKEPELMLKRCIDRIPLTGSL
jgi:hypothetical protein